SARRPAYRHGAAWRWPGTRPETAPRERRDWGASKDWPGRSRRKLRIQPLGLLARELFEPANYYVTEVRVQLHEERPASRPLGSDQRGAGAAERVEHAIAATGTVGDRANNKFDRLHGWVFLGPFGTRDLPHVVQVASGAERGFAGRLPAVPDWLVTT